MSIFGHASDPPLDQDTAERLLDRRVAAADAPPGYEPIVALFAAGTERPTPAELAGEDAAVAQFRQHYVPAPPARRRRMARPALVTGIASAILVAGAVSAAATGVLPAPVQRIAHAAFADVGIGVPNTGSARQSSPSVVSTTTTPGCSPTSTATCPARDNTHGATVCTVASDGTCRDNHGTTVCTAASDGTCRDNHGTTVCVVASADACHGAAAGSTPPGRPTHPSTNPHASTGPPDSTPTDGHTNNGHSSPPTTAATTATTTSPHGHGHGSTNKGNPSSP